MKKVNKFSSYKDLIQKNYQIKKELPTSFDVIGDIALIKLKDDLLNYKNKIADALIKSNHHIKTVCLANPVSGELRTRDIEVIGGINNTETIHKEFGINLYLNIKKVYFSPRLSNERKRIADNVKENETIIDMFAGVSPFSIMIAKYANPKIIYSIDKNKSAFEYSKINITKNKVLDKIELIHGDAKTVVNNLFKKNIRADRIIMNLPFSAFNFITNAFLIMEKNCIIHYYDILNIEEIDKRIQNLEEKAEKMKISLKNISYHKIKSYSPREFYIGFDITAKRNHADVA